MAALTIDAAAEKDYGTRTAVRDLTLQVGRGEAFGFLGPNGAGKSTSIKMLLGLVKPTSGQRSLARPTGRHRAMCAPASGFFPSTSASTTGSPRRSCSCFTAGCAAWPNSLRRKVPQLLERVGLGAQNTKPIRSYSKGMMQRVGLAQAMVNEPEILFLDEPTSGLDPAGRKLVREIVA